jgi:hypothetical protein
VHPRDDSADYESVGVPVVQASSEPITTTILTSDAVLSIVSTGLIEAVILGKPTSVLAIHPDWRRYHRSFAADPAFAAIRSLRDLATSLGSWQRQIDPAGMDMQRRAIRNYVEATGESAARKIASAIIGLA